MDFTVPLEFQPVKEDTSEEKLGFTRCGTIYVEEDDYPRIAFEKIRDLPIIKGY